MYRGIWTVFVFEGFLVGYFVSVDGVFGVVYKLGERGREGIYNYKLVRIIFCWYSGYFTGGYESLFSFLGGRV